MGAIFRRKPRFLVTVAVCAYAAAVSAKAPQAPIFDAAEDLRTQDGHVSLVWDHDGAGEEWEHELEQDTQASFASARVRYRGPETQLFLSGLADGEYYVRVRSRARAGGGGWGEWSHPRRVIVAHHSLSLSLTLLSVGALVFLATAAFVLVRSRSETSTE